MSESHQPIEAPQNGSDKEFRTICDIHREAFRLALDLPDGEAKDLILELIKEAYECGIRMNDKLKSYKKKWKPDVYERID